LHDAQQWNVRLTDRLEEPFFLQEMLMLRVSNEREMSVENESEVPQHFKTLGERQARDQGGSASPKTV
jgi:hypothetical protein